VGSFLADAGLVLEPDLNWRAGCAGEQRAPQQAGEVFLKACSAAASFFGWNGRGCSRVRRNWFSHLPIVLSCTVTAKRRHLGPQVNAPPAHDLVHVRIRPFNDQRTQLRHLRAGQGARTAGTHLRLQTGNARVVVAANPVAQRLPVHAVLRRSLAARPAFQDASQRQEPANLSRVLAFARKQAKSGRRMIRPRDRQ